MRDKNGDFEIGDPPMQSFDEREEGGVDAQEDESMKMCWYWNGNLAD